ncbi:MAG: hypothetical protein K0R71_1446 [Bacillales bacterium]|jgi:rhodanese-related sulfurtransferase|nr:hypothetical protein [Bacillales bacterium]
MNPKIKYMAFSYLIGGVIIWMAFLLVPSFDEAPYKTITPHQAWKQMNAKKNILILDVRTLNEYSQEKIPDAVHFPIGKIKVDSKGLPAQKNQTIFVYSSAEVDSEKATRKLIELGYSKVYDLGSIDGWPYDIEIIKE